MGRYVNEDPNGLASGDVNLYRHKYNGPYTNMRRPPEGRGLFEALSDLLFGPITDLVIAANSFSRDEPEYGDILQRVMTVDARGPNGQTSILSARQAWFDPGFRDRIGTASAMIGGLVEFGAMWTYGGMGVEAMSAGRMMSNMTRSRSLTAGGRISSAADNLASAGTRNADDALRRAPT